MELTVAIRGTADADRWTAWAERDAYLRRDPLAERKATLASLLSRASSGLRFNERLDERTAPSRPLSADRRGARQAAGRAPASLTARRLRASGTGSRASIASDTATTMPAYSSTPST
jgi:hypothetical protein